jgi:hypothetical protein
MNREADAVRAVLFKLSESAPMTRLVLWLGSSYTGQSRHHRDALLGVYLTTGLAGEGRSLFYTKRLGADRLYPLDPADIVLVANATGDPVYYKHPEYKPVFDWGGAAIVPSGGEALGRFYDIKARFVGRSGDYCAGSFASYNEASRFLKLAQQLDVTP